MVSFTSRVRNGEVSQPTQRAFSLKKWQQAFDNTINPSDEDIRLYESGKWAFDKFEIIRNQLISFSFEGISKQTILRLLISTANRATHILSYAHLPHKKGDIAFAEQPLQANLSKINKVSPKSTPDMILMSSIDGLRFPLKVALSLEKDISTILSDEEVFIKINGAILLGQFYDHIDAYWMRCLWNDWYIDSTAEADYITPPETDFPQIEAVSEYRRQVLTSELIFHFQTIWQKFDEETKQGFLSSTPQIIIKGSGKKQKYDIRSYKTDEIRSKAIIINRVISDKGYYTPFLKQELPNLPQITVEELLKFWEVMHSIGVAQIDKLSPPNKEREFKTIEDAFIFSPILYFDQTEILLKKWLGFSTEKIQRIIKFFTFNSTSKFELWGQPIIKLDNRRFVLLWSPTVYGNMERTIELLMRQGSFDFGKNGFLFEDYAREELINTLSASPVLKDAEIYPKSLYLKTENGEEEIDLIIRLGNTILIGEIKCILFPSEPIERFRYFDILKSATDQVQRKLQFVKDNERGFRESSRLPVSLENKELSFYSFVLVNQPFGSGFVIKNTPIVDLLIFQRFFANEWQQLVMFDGKNEPIPTRTLKFYKSETEAAQIIFKYLCKPPQLRHYVESLKEEIYCLPVLNKGSKPICLRTPIVSLPMPKIDYELSQTHWGGKSRMS